MVAVGALVALVAAGLPHLASGGSAPISEEEYVIEVEPICERNTDANARILKGVKAEVLDGELEKASKRFKRAADAFEKTIAQIEAVPQPAEDEARLAKWIDVLAAEADLLRGIGDALAHGEKYKAQKLAVRLNRNADRANNIVLGFGFDQCRLDASRFL